MSVANNSSVLEFLDLSLHINELCWCACQTNQQFHTCYPKKSINKFPKEIALRLRRICDSDEKFDVQSSEYQNYLKARGYNPPLIKKVSLC